MYTYLLFLLASTPLVFGQLAQTLEPISELCLGCICEAASNCNRTLQCNGEVCGIFRITWAYWADANKPTLDLDDPNDPQAYSRCANELRCAAKTVVAYMNRFAQWESCKIRQLELRFLLDAEHFCGKFILCSCEGPATLDIPKWATCSINYNSTTYKIDCNNDGVVNCWDYAAIHRLGGYGCRGQLDYPYYSKFANCQQWVQSQLTQSSGGVASNDQFELFA